MAGTDFYIEFRRTDEGDLVRKVLGCIQRMAKPDLDFRFQKKGYEYHVTVDGPLTCMQVFLWKMGPFLGGVAMGASELTLKRRQALVKKVLVGYYRGVKKIEADIAELSKMIGGTPGSYKFEANWDPDLQAAVDTLTESVIIWELGLLAPRIMVETWHTAFETALRRYHYGDQSLSFRDMVNNVAAREALSPSQKSCLLELNDKRQLVKHFGSGVRKNWLAENVAELTETMHKILSSVSTRRSSNL